jgi:hypothetical protein
MPADVGSLRQALLRGIKLSMQGSYARRIPAEEAVPHLEEARRGLRHLVEKDPMNVETWRLLSQAEECMLNYAGATTCLERAIELSKTGRKKDLRRLALLKESLRAWQDLLLTPDQLRELGECLVQAGAELEPNGRTLMFTRQWLHDRGFADAEAVLEALRRRGAYTDFQVLQNVVRG